MGERKHTAHDFSEKQKERGVQMNEPDMLSLC
jgi:hypothetical protein